MSDDKAWSFLTGNVAEIYIPGGLTNVTARAKTNSHYTQKITLTKKDGGAQVAEFSGAGEKNNAIGNKVLDAEEKGTRYLASFEFSEADGVFKPSKLNCGGPYDIGNYNLLVIVAENGDDSDYNDSILEFCWYGKK